MFKVQIESGFGAEQVGCCVLGTYCFWILDPNVDNKNSFR